MDADEVLRLNRSTACRSFLQTVDSPERGRLNNYSYTGALRRPAALIPVSET